MSLLLRQHTPLDSSTDLQLDFVYHSKFSSSPSQVIFKKISIFLPDEQGVPLLVHDDASSAHEQSSILRQFQVVLSHGHPVLPAGAVWWQRQHLVAVMLWNLFKDFLKATLANIQRNEWHEIEKKIHIYVFNEIKPVVTVVSSFALRK